MTNKMITCAMCGEKKPHRSKGFCSKCYYKQYRDTDEYRAKARERQRKVRAGEIGPIKTCIRCNEDKPHFAKGMCWTCWRTDHQSTPEYKAKHAEYERNRRAEMGEEYNRRERERAKTPRRKAWTRKYNYEYYRKHKKRLKAYAAEYRRADSDRQAVYDQRRRSREQNAESTLTPEQWSDILEQYNYSCFYCGATGVPLEIEHMIPLSRGGGLTEDNVVPACHSCNCSKKTMTPEEYAEFLEDNGQPYDFQP